jgi:predicted nucleotidyltransferase
MFIDYDADGSFTFVEWSRLEEFLEQLLKRDVDLMTRASLHPRLKQQIESSSIKVF